MLLENKKDIKMNFCKHCGERVAIIKNGIVGEITKIFM